MDPAVGDDVVDIPVQQHPGVQGHVETAERGCMLAGVEVDAAEFVLSLPGAGVRELDVPSILVDLVVGVRT